MRKTSKMEKYGWLQKGNGNTVYLDLDMEQMKRGAVYERKGENIEFLVDSGRDDLLLVYGGPISDIIIGNFGISVGRLSMRGLKKGEMGYQDRRIFLELHAESDRDFEEEGKILGVNK